VNTVSTTTTLILAISITLYICIIVFDLIR
jgi:hypothetical protein